MIEVRHLVKDYGPLRALDGVSFSVAPGEVVGFLGPNGAGKTTCMKIITGFISATSGSVLVNGMDTFENGPETRKLMGYLPENSPVYAEMTVSEYLTFIARVRGVPADGIKRRVFVTAEATGLEKRLNQETGTLSRGFRQRTGLAAALIHNPEILVLDEPATGLDPNQIIEIRNLIRELGRDRTVILSTHNLSEVTAVCNRIVIVHHGRVAADGTPESIRDEHGGGNSCVLSLAAGDGIKNALEAADSIRSIDGCESVTTTDSESPDVVSFRVQPVPGFDIRQRLFEHVVASGWKMVEMKNEKLDLETIFHRLTARGA